MISATFRLNKSIKGVLRLKISFENITFVANKEVSYDKIIDDKRSKYLGKRALE